MGVVIIWVNLFEAESYDEEAQLKIVMSLTIDDLAKTLKGGEALATEWLKVHGFDAEFRIAAQGRQIGVGKGMNIIDLREQPLIISPDHKCRCMACGRRL